MGQFEETQQLITTVAKHLDVSQEVIGTLLEPDRFIEFEIDLHLDDGTEVKLPAYRSQHKSPFGPYKGGIRFHHSVSPSEVKALSMWMSLKTSLLNLPFGGAKGGVNVDVRSLSDIELEQIARKYVQGVYKYIGADIDVPAPDVNTNSQTMAWMLDEYESLAGVRAPATFTGKPLELGGSEGRDAATGVGGVYALKAFVENVRALKPGATVAIQGFGNVATWFASEVGKHMDVRIVAISDSSGALYNPQGFADIANAVSFKQDGGSLSNLDLAGVELITNEQLLQLDVDVLVPAALEGVIDESNANLIKAGLILELANGPVTATADRILEGNHIEIIPDIFANAGGVTVSYFEWVQNRTGDYWSRDEVMSRLENRMSAAFKEMVVQRESEETWRNVAYKVALRRIISAYKLRGL